MQSATGTIRGKTQLLNAALWALAGMLICVVGCQTDRSKLTDAELARIALAKEVELVKASGGLVLMVGGEALSSEKIIQTPVQIGQRKVSLAEYLKPIAQRTELEQFKQQGQRDVEDVVMNEISNILLYQHAKRQLGDSEQVQEALKKLAEKEWRQFVLQFGGDEAKADEALAKMDMDREKFKQQRKRAIMTQSYIASQLTDKQPITYSDLRDYYERVKNKLFAKKGRLVFRLIDIDVMKVGLSDPNEDPLQKARELAAALAERIKKGEDFAELAKQYSHGHRRAFGGLWPAVTPGSLAKPYDVLAAEAKKLQVGQVSEPIESGGHIFLMKLEDKQAEGYEPFEKVQQRVRQLLVEERRKQAVRRLGSKLLSQAEVGRTDEFIDFCLERIYRLSRP